MLTEKATIKVVSEMNKWIQKNERLTVDQVNTQLGKLFAKYYSKATKKKDTWKPYAREKFFSIFDFHTEYLLEKIFPDCIEEIYNNEVREHFFNTLWITFLGSKIRLESDYTPDSLNNNDSLIIEKEISEYFKTQEMIYTPYSKNTLKLTINIRIAFYNIINNRIQQEIRTAKENQISEFRILWSENKLINYLKPELRSFNPFSRIYFTYLALFKKADSIYSKNYSDQVPDGYKLALQDANKELHIYLKSGFKNFLPYLLTAYEEYRENNQRIAEYVKENEDKELMVTENKNKQRRFKNVR